MGGKQAMGARAEIEVEMEVKAGVEVEVMLVKPNGRAVIW
jgi:hypothetical protein